MKRDRSFLYVIPRATLDELGVPQVLDMLRYDGATVQCNPPDGFYLLHTDSPRGPCVDRWKSFGVRIAPWQIAQGPENRYRLIDEARDRLAKYNALVDEAARIVAEKASGH